jgi:putative ABC transport system permease protein
VGTGGAEQWLEIVGVVETFGTNFTNPDRSEALYQPLGSADLHPMRYIIEVADDPATFLPTLRTIAADVDPEAIIQSARPLTDLVALSLLELRAASILVFVLSAIGMLLAATGLYALMSFTVSQRTREIGIRMALGAQQQTVHGMFLQQGLWLVGMGIVAGLAAAVPLARLMSALLFGVSSLDPATYGAVSFLLISAALLATYLPTLKATRVEPVEALRTD